MMMLIGALVIAIGFGLIHIDPSAIHAPPWVLALFGGIFVFAGLWSIFKSTVGEGTPRADWMNFLFGLLVMLAMSVLCLWIGFGPGERLFVQDIGTGLDPATRPVDPVAGRIFFGLFGILLSGFTVAFAVTRVRKQLGRGNKPS
jgi:hypothetical protein